MGIFLSSSHGTILAPKLPPWQVAPATTLKQGVMLRVTLNPCVLITWEKSSSPDGVCSPTSRKPTRSDFIWPWSYLGIGTEVANVNGKGASWGRRERLGSAGKHSSSRQITLQRPQGMDIKINLFPSVIPLSLWLILRKILETSWLVP